MNALRVLTARRGFDGAIHVFGQFIGHAAHPVAVLTDTRAAALRDQLAAALADSRRENPDQEELA